MHVARGRAHSDSDDQLHFSGIESEQILSKALGKKKSGDLPPLPYCNRGYSQEQAKAFKQLFGYKLSSRLDRVLLSGVLDSDEAPFKTAKVDLK